MKSSIITIQHAAEGLGGPLFAVLVCWYLSLQGYFHGYEDLIFFFYVLTLVGFVFGLLKRRYFLLGLLPFVAFSVIVRYSFESYYVTSDSLVQQSAMLFLGLLFCIPSFIVGWILRVGGETTYRYFKLQQAKSV